MASLHLVVGYPQKMGVVEEIFGYSAEIAETMALLHAIRTSKCDHTDYTDHISVLLMVLNCILLDPRSCSLAQIPGV